MKFMRRVGWPVTLFVPLTLALVIAVAGIYSPGVPRIYFILGFLFTLIVLPGILITLKVLSHPVTAAVVTLVTTRRGQNVVVMFEDGTKNTYQNAQLYAGLLTGELKPGQRFRVLIRDDLLFRFQPLDDEDTPR
ncbi:hypothetical protein [Candidatus Desulforudis audaxviator]|uniref:hypothetical protein n=1 Tax=Candidatus Desulforudis audaxviator TaxID=471827 RepID=UPI00107C26A4|nr:hypothetical protein [Candidatus Desulforudis audaxviator]AZK60565.1 hypothetical protein Daudx_2035 [Candidatus Desulforudis audaxviator]